VVPNVSTKTVDASYYTVKTADLGDDCTFHIVFTQDFCDHLATNDKVIVYYDAMLNRNAIVAGEGNTNESKLEFGEDHESNPDQTTTNTFGFDLVKTDSQGIRIDGAKFKIYDKEIGGNEVAVVILTATTTEDEASALTDSNGNKLMFDDDNDPETPAKMVSKVEEYRRARADETGVEIVVKDGMVRLVGFDNGTYYLEETEAPDGYNKLTGRQSFTISDGNLDARFDVDGKISAGSGVQVINKTGSMLPETGAMGTLLFISFGMFVALGTGILLVTKKRMSMIED
jgi:LPXTG-motif cell wall-anchored protein